MGSFVFRWPHPNANDVHVTGTFDDWSKSEQLNKVGEIWEKEVTLSEADKKILYKFVVDDVWTIDTTAPQEDDGHGNLNNVLHPDQIKTKAAVVPEAVTTSSAAPTSTTAALAGGVPLESRKEASEVTPASESALTKETSGSSPPGAFPETPMKEPDSFGVSPLPATSGDSNPVNVPAGEKLPPQSDVTANTLQSSVTTSKEDYEKAGQEPESFSVNPIPASVGAGNPVDVPAGEKLPEAGQVTSNTIDSTATTSKEDYEKAGSSVPFLGGALAAVGLGTAGEAALSSKKEENLIPESSLPMGADAGKTLDAGPTITSAAPISTTAELAGKVPLEERKEAIVDDVRATTETVPEVVKESIAEAHVSPEATTSAEAVKEKSEVEQELLKKIPSTDGASEPAPTIAAATSETAPAATAATPSSPSGPAGTLGTNSSAAAAVADGTDAAEAPTSLPHTTAPAEKTEGDNTEYAPPHASGSAPGVSPAAAAALSDGTEDPTLLDEPAVQYLKQNEAAADATVPETKVGEAAAAPSTTETPKDAAKTETPAAVAAAPETKKETPAAASSATETPKKAAATTPTTSPATGSASKEKKKKHRISSLFKKIFD
ncbi:uncharacterized protein A1O9_00293 [Exophiala aquamarina CBS 119918]|uniref:AMP-activated protein kinase glycogen-binding domain-containing protein n=1 Tax=Exophiala aquamarina CBS 119918 TaxID=1182545 RepID=A0A072PR42_9EURO|nr:uncharacterized protein A1O9_00293 [Exophiala aquamarina CBS 119918]KEF62321.1 hypothetical protein A1O9_00293 [Exophiala aquamarina CBS 119918]